MSGKDHQDSKKWSKILTIVETILARVQEVCLQDMQLDICFYIVNKVVKALKGSKTDSDGSCLRLF